MNVRILNFIIQITCLSKKVNGDKQWHVMIEILMIGSYITIPKIVRDFNYLHVLSVLTVLQIF